MAGRGCSGSAARRDSSADGGGNSDATFAAAAAASASAAAAAAAEFAWVRDDGGRGLRDSGSAESVANAGARAGLSIRLLAGGAPGSCSRQEDGVMRVVLPATSWTRDTTRVGGPLWLLPGGSMPAVLRTIGVSWRSRGALDRSGARAWAWTRRMLMRVMCGGAAA